MEQLDERDLFDFDHHSSSPPSIISAKHGKSGQHWRLAESLIGGHYVGQVEFAVIYDFRAWIDSVRLDSRME